MDVIAMHQAGFNNAVASLGTARTSGHASLMSRYTKEVLLTYDSDEAGQKAALRGIPILKAAGIRADIDTRAEKMGYKIREAQLQKIPYMLVVGGKEEENEAVSVRSRFKGDEGQMKLDDFLAAIKEEIANRENRKVEKED